MSQQVPGDGCQVVTNKNLENLALICYFIDELYVT